MIVLMLSNVAMVFGCIERMAPSVIISLPTTLIEWFRRAV
jgi:uncharacterized protein (DUF3820 family)